MAGHETAQVRPHDSQDPLKIAAGSPLAVQGIFIEILRERFGEDSGLGLVWNEDPTLTDILIEASYNENTETRDPIPAVYITRTQTVPGRVVIGDKGGVSLPEHLEAFAALLSVGISMECVSNVNGESAILGDITQWTVLASQKVIQKAFGFYDVSLPQLGPTTPFARDAVKWSTVVDFTVQYWARWAQQPMAPLLQQISQKVAVNADYFHLVALNSSRRG